MIRVRVRDLGAHSRERSIGPDAGKGSALDEGPGIDLEAVPGGTVEVVDLDAGHDVMISRPALLAALIDGVAARS